MLTPADRNRIAVNTWTARIIPIVLAGVVGYATFVLVAQLCVKYLLVKHSDKSAAIPILVIYFILFILMAASFLRLVHITITDPPYVPLGAAALRERQSFSGKGRAKAKGDAISMGEYNSRGSSGGSSPEAIDSERDDPDSAGLELFYTKDVFVCSNDGWPIWCGECCNWKPDRAHHDSSSGRCIRKMDHFCPWVGGAVGENNYKFFTQFVTYTALYCTHLLVVMAYYVRKQIMNQGESVNRQFIAILALATFFGLFTGGMAGTSLNLATLNLTQVERLGERTKLYILAIIKTTPELTYPPQSLGRITYPLEASRPAISRPDASTASPIGPQEAPAMHNQPPQSDKSQDTPVQAPQHDRTNLGEGPISVPGSSPITTLEVAQPTEMKTFHAVQEPAQSVRPGDITSGRDSQANRTFTIMNMLEPGDNPWDMGSRRRNFETVMGKSVIDWLLPLRRSPCCNHEGTESQFAIGPKVALLCATMDPNYSPAAPPNQQSGLEMIVLNAAAV